MYLKSTIQQKLMRRSGMALLTAGLIVPLSRGPWIGAVVLLLVFIATGRNPVRPLVNLAIGGNARLALDCSAPGYRQGNQSIAFYWINGKRKR